MVMSLSKPLDQLVLPGREAQWEAEKPNWFVLDPNCPDQKREPGLNLIWLAMIYYIIKVCWKKNFPFKMGRLYF